MPPEFSEWNQVPRKLQGQIRVKVGADMLKALIGQGDFLALTNNGEVTKVVLASEVPPGVIADAKKHVSPWNLIHGLPTTVHAKSKQRGNRESWESQDALAGR